LSSSYLSYNATLSMYNRLRLSHCTHAIMLVASTTVVSLTFRISRTCQLCDRTVRHRRDHLKKPLRLVHNNHCTLVESRLNTNLSRCLIVDNHHMTNPICTRLKQRVLSRGDDHITVATNCCRSLREPHEDDEHERYGCEDSPLKCNESHSYCD